MKFETCINNEIFAKVQKNGEMKILELLIIKFSSLYFHLYSFELLVSKLCRYMANDEHNKHVSITYSTYQSFMLKSNVNSIIDFRDQYTLYDK